MHELGIVFYIIKDVKAAAQENKASEISSVTIQLGEVSGVIPEYLTDCWKWAIKKEGPILEKSEYIEALVKSREEDDVNIFINTSHNFKKR